MIVFRYWKPVRLLFMPVTLQGCEQQLRHCFPDFFHCFILILVTGNDNSFVFKISCSVEIWSFYKGQASRFSVLFIFVDMVASNGSIFWRQFCWMLLSRVRPALAKTEFHHESWIAMPQHSCLLIASSELLVVLGSYFQLSFRCCCLGVNAGMEDNCFSVKSLSTQMWHFGRHQNENCMLTPFPKFRISRTGGNLI